MDWRKKRILITHVDNTLLDWQDLWYQTFSAMMEKVIEISGVDPERLYAECSIIHQTYGTSEYSRLLEELPSLRELYGDSVLSAMAPAIEAFREARRNSLRLYPTVEASLTELKAEGVLIAAFTESKALWTISIRPMIILCRTAQPAHDTMMQIAIISKERSIALHRKAK
jgi:FMN phosphatase YigB (HAD superfamily)